MGSDNEKKQGEKKPTPSLVDQAEAFAKYHDQQADHGGACGREFHARAATFIRRLADEVAPIPTNEALLRESMAMVDPDVILFDGFDEALVGTFQRCGQPVVAVYSYERCLDVLVADGLTMDEAEEHMGFNVEGGWLGPQTPAVLHPIRYEAFEPVEQVAPVAHVKISQCEPTKAPEPKNSDDARVTEENGRILIKTGPWSDWSLTRAQAYALYLDMHAVLTTWTTPIAKALEKRWDDARRLQGREILRAVLTGCDNNEENEESIMSKYEIGQRVGAIRNSKGDTVYMYGWGTYQGEEVPPVGTAGPFGMDASLIGPNHKILLDSGQAVFGCQCWWGSEKVIKGKIANFKNVEMVPVPDQMEPEKDDGDEDGEGAET